MMAHIRRWAHDLFAHIDSLVVQVENHEAQVTTAIRELGHVVARARVQLKRVDRDGTTLRDRLAAQVDARDRWRERAAREPDDDRALECLRRGRQASRQVQRLRDQIDEHDRSQRQLNRDVKKLEERLQELVEQRNRMATRQTRAEAMCVVQGPESGLDGVLDEVFDRWDTRVTATEYESGCIEDPFDELEQDFATEEEDRELREELAELRRNA